MIWNTFWSKGPDICTHESDKLFKSAKNLGYEIFEPELPLSQKPGCQNKHYTNNLLLIQKEVKNRSAIDNKEERIK